MLPSGDFLRYMGKHTKIMIHEKYAEGKVGYFNDKNRELNSFFRLVSFLEHKSTKEFVTIELTRLTTITTDLKIEEVLQNAESD